MAKISKHGGPTVNPDEPVMIVRAELGYESPVAQDVSEEQWQGQATAEEETAKTEAGEPKATPRPKRK